MATSTTVGLPSCGLLATTVGTYAHDESTIVVTCPAWETHNLLLSATTQPIAISLDGGVTDHITIPATTIFVTGLRIPAGAVIEARYLTAGATNVRVSVW